MTEGLGNSITRTQTSHLKASAANAYLMESFGNVIPLLVRWVVATGQRTTRAVQASAAEMAEVRRLDSGQGQPSVVNET